MTETSSTEAGETQQVVQQLADEACVSLFEAYGVKLDRIARGTTPRGEHVLTGIVGFTGMGITGMCLMAASQEPLAASNPTDGSLRDWIAELSNQLAGRLKHKLLSHGSEVYITTPIVLRATRIEPLPKCELVPSAFRGGEGVLAVWVEVDVSPGFQLVPSSGEEAVAAGETLLF